MTLLKKGVIMKRKFLKIGLTLTVLTSAFVLVGCSEKDLSIQKKECLQQDKKFLTKKVLNFRTGEYVIKGECV